MADEVEAGTWWCDNVVLFIRLTPSRVVRRPGNRSIILLDTSTMPAETARYRWDELPLDKVTDMVSRKAVTGAELALAQAYYKKGTLVPVHRHESERLIYVLQGAVCVQSAGGDVTVREGEVLVVPAGTAHQAEFIDDTFLLTVMRAEPPITPPVSAS
jgi:quercetin dioxygenase-like cupin family protein